MNYVWKNLGLGGGLWRVAYKRSTARLPPPPRLRARRRGAAAARRAARRPPRRARPPPPPPPQPTTRLAPPLQDARDHLREIKRLKSFEFVNPDGKDEGVNVREKAKQLVELLDQKSRAS